MPFFAFMGSMFSSLAGFFAVWLSKKSAIALALVSTYGVLTVGIILAIMTSISAAQTSFSGLGGLPGSFTLGLTYFMPDNLSLCIGLCIAARVQVTAYLWNVQNLKFMSAA